MTALVFDHVSVFFGRRRSSFTAVDDVSLSVAGGEILGLVGESGSGKSTLARAAVGLVEPSAGSISLDGEEITRASGEGAQHRRRIQMIFQDPSSCLDPRRTIGASIEEALFAAARREGVRPAGSAARRDRVSSLLRSVSLSAALAAALPSQLSGGQRQRVAIARAVATEPQVILADEITSALDVSVQGAVLNRLLELQREQGFSMIFISHNLAVVRLVCDRVAVLRGGRLQECGPVEDVLSAPTADYTRELIAAVPSLPAIPGSGGSAPPSVALTKTGSPR